MEEEKIYNERPVGMKKGEIAFVRNYQGGITRYTCILPGRAYKVEVVKKCSAKIKL